MSRLQLQMSWGLLVLVLVLLMVMMSEAVLVLLHMKDLMMVMRVVEAWSPRARIVHVTEWVVLDSLRPDALRIRGESRCRSKVKCSGIWREQVACRA